MMTQMIYSHQLKACATAASLDKQPGKQQPTSPGGTATSSANSSGAKRKEKEEWDGDVRQRDIYCRSHGGVDQLILRQYPSIPTPSAPDHVLLKIEVSFI